ncbi:hypothetical protein ESP57_06535 [Agromyces fucosus]|uniref:Uncharacterized protein n=1 Tax=Agromyces fucosus TaxID=41985 RepID=A0A4Q2JKL5_9MICO|nr:hypothetical protein [Agromyces fucosus]RXZ48651.1 hypothetical protein ESP57_06535 [Agromyces fucosus]
MSATATIALGFANLEWPANLGFVCSALVTTVSALEPFFNWRSRWVLADETLAKWHELEDELFFFVATRKEEELTIEELLHFQNRSAFIWRELTAEWVTARRTNGVG